MQRGMLATVYSLFLCIGCGGESITPSYYTSQGIPVYSADGYTEPATVDATIEQVLFWVKTYDNTVNVNDLRTRMKHGDLKLHFVPNTITLGDVSYDGIYTKGNMTVQSRLDGLVACTSLPHELGHWIHEVTYSDMDAQHIDERYFSIQGFVAWIESKCRDIH